MAVTEVCLFTIAPNEAVSPEVESQYREALSIVTSQPGCLRVLEGICIEDPSKLLWLLEWESIKDHEKFQGLEEYKKFLQLAHGRFAPGRPEVYHIELVKDRLKAPEAGYVTSYSYFLVEEGKLDEVLKGFKKMDDHATATGKGPASATTGAGIENKNVVLVLTNWKSPETHMAFAKDPSNAVLKDTMPLITKTTFYHFKLQKA